MYRLSGMTQSSTSIVSNVQYNAANQMQTMNYSGLSESRTYNVLNQLINITAGSENLTYNYPTGTNNGKVSSMYNATSGETVTYAYDSLNRLLSASSSAGWGQQYGFDSFGNLLSKTVTGSGPSLSQAVNAANNQIVGQTYDNNGNTSYATTAGLTYNLYYDAENRLNMIYYSGQTTAQYGYDAQNHRIWISTGAKDPYGNPTYLVNFYSPSGQKLATYTFVYYGSTLGVTLASSDQYFGARRLAAMDQLGSVGNYFPWGEDKGGTSPQNTWNFATYWRDSVSGLDYAQNRYYSNITGSFMTPDPYLASGGPASPESWNRYSYIRGDPANRYDPEGLDDCPPGWICQSFSPYPTPPTPLPPPSTGWQWTPPQTGLPFNPQPTSIIFNSWCGPMTFTPGSLSSINPLCLTGCPSGQTLTANYQCVSYQQELNCQYAINGQITLTGLVIELGILAVLPGPLGPEFKVAATVDTGLAYLDSLYIKANCSNFSPPMFMLTQ